MKKLLLLLITSVVIISLMLGVSGCAKPAPAPAPAPTPAPAPAPKPAPAPAPAPTPPPAPPKPTYPIKDVTWYIHQKPGGGYDLIARTLSQYVGEYLPQKVNFTIESLEGSGGVRMVLALSQATPDGYTIGYVPSGNIAVQVLKPKEALYDVTKFEPIFAAFALRYAVFVKATSPIKTIDDLLKMPKWSNIDRAVGSEANIRETAFLDIFQLKPNMVPTGTEEEWVMLMRGDGDINVGDIGAGSQYVKSGDLRAILVFRNVRDAALPDVPCLADVGKTGIPDALLEPLYAVYAPPGTPKEIVKILEEAFLKTAQKSEVKAFETSTKRWIKLVNSDGVRKYVTDTIALITKYPQYYQ